MFKEDLRKEISLRKINSDFPLKFVSDFVIKRIQIQLSSSFFKRDTDLTPEEREHENNITQDNIDVGEIENSETKKRRLSKSKENLEGVDVLSEEPFTCIICYEKEPNTIIEPCGHGGLCADCMLNLIQKEKICPLCRNVIF